MNYFCVEVRDVNELETSRKKIELQLTIWIIICNRDLEE